MIRIGCIILGLLFVSNRGFAVARELTAGFKQLVAGNDTTCALRADKTATCWGAGLHGELGDGIFSLYSSQPVNVASPLLRIEWLAEGDFHLCGRSATGNVACWGANTRHQASASSAMILGWPQFPISINATAVAAGGLFSCAIVVGGNVQCWGGNDEGQLGTGDKLDRDAPALVMDAAMNPLSGVVSLSAGMAHVCAVLADATAVCWGSNKDGQLGVGDNLTHDALVTVLDGITPLRGIVAIAAGGAHTCALLDSTYVRCWGSNDAGQVGKGSTGDSYLPWLVTDGASALGGVRSVSTGGRHTCVTLSSGNALCWGDNSFDQLGTGDMASAHFSPAVVLYDVSQPLENVTAIAAGAIHTCAVTEGNTILCWGDNTYGENGDGGHGAGTQNIFATRSSADPTLFYSDFEYEK